MHHGVAGFYRNAHRGSLVEEWIPALDGVAERLRAGGRVADVGCGHGHSTVVMAEAFPAATFHGYDVHPESIEAARENARRAGVADRVTFEVADSRSYPATGYDPVCFFDCLHDMGDPEGALAHAAAAPAPGGTVMMVEPFAGDRLEDNLNPIGRIYHTASTTLCTAHALSEDGPTPSAPRPRSSLRRRMAGRRRGVVTRESSGWDPVTLAPGSARAGRRTVGGCAAGPPTTLRCRPTRLRPPMPTATSRWTHRAGADRSSCSRPTRAR